MEGFRLQSYQAGGPVHEEGSAMDEESMEGDSRSRFALRQHRTPSYEYESESVCGPGCGEKPWVRRGSKWLLVGSCVALVALVLFALISSLASRSGDTPSVHIPTWARWEVVCLGTGGGLDQSDLPDSPVYVSLDAGTTLFGLQRALTSNPSLSVPSPSAGPELTTAGALYRNSVRTYLISHSHLDHITGLVVGSPDDAYATPRKVVAGTNFTIDTLQSHVFNWKVWPNMGSAGNAPTGLYNLLALPVGEEWNVTAPSLAVRPFLLSHGKMGDGSTYFSTAFLLRAEDDYLLYFGDTGADQVEGNDYMKQVWTNVAPIVRAGKMKAIFLECSYGEERSDDKLYGHLNPQRFMQEIGVLSQLVAGGLEGLKVVVIHIKADDLIYRKQESAYDTIRRQLMARNTYGVDLVFPRQGDWLYY